MWNVNTVLLSQSSTPSTSMDLEDFISDDAQVYIDIYLISIACMFIAIFGMASNIINFLILTKQGIKDCVSICLVSLTFSDFFVAVFLFAGSVCYSMAISDTQYYVDPLAVNIILSWTWGMIFDISMLTTAFISVERCITVLFPFKFKHLVTFNRALICLFCMYVTTIAGYMALFTTQELSLQLDEKVNSTRIMLWLSENRVQVEEYSNISIHVVYGTLCEILVVSSTYGLISGLRSSNKFRAGTVKIDSSAGLSRRNKMIVKMVTVLAGIFIVCNVIRLMFNYARLAVPEIMFGKRFHNTFNTFLRIMFLSDTVGASTNIIVYYFFKPSFKHIFLSLFTRNRHPPRIRDQEDEN